MDQSDELVNEPSLLPEGLVDLAKDFGDKPKPQDFENTQDSSKAKVDFESFKAKDDFDFEGYDNGETPETIPLEDFADIDPDPSPVNTHEVLQR
jgi:hypothetical protein